ncbi:helix-turn-helix transcriptional regulator [Pedobacter polaris]|uniref:Helix-turn-helix transcriptional regulator n=1 Tax=Pedobacter polaris TaxID=2571273 RepID=A0A4U1CQY9_9SPHI|nr:AraC family transcriptional regulator [Pedobacter polaris]TKC10547.1 helix-turn-helix transcriptional regulator [Pedobacter polaris]
MEKLNSGEFFGITNQRLDTDGLILTNTAYTHDYVDWHHHENAYFTFILSGKVIEGSKKGKVNLSAGSLLFHNAQESHYNIKPKGNTYGMHLELEPRWMDEIYATVKGKEGSFEVSCHQTKIIFYKILKESRMADDTVELGIQHLVIEAMASLFPEQSGSNFYPSWIKRVTELLQDNYLSKLDLKAIAEVAGVHPVHLSRSFSKYLGCTMAEYIRRLKVERALSQLSAPGTSLSSIAYQFGFADQSHMIRCFKEISGDTPLFFRKLINSL